MERTRPFRRFPARIARRRRWRGSIQRPWCCRASRATPSGLARAAKGETVLHFAGHAVVDAERPWISHLVLAPDSGGRQRIDGCCAAHAHRRRKWTSWCWQLVVRPRPEEGASEGFAGFADALLAAGVGAAIGSIWDVPDRDASALLERFHELYASGVPPPDALRDRHNSKRWSRADTRERNPFAWAGFRAVTR